MKKLLAILFSLIMIFSFAACDTIKVDEECSTCEEVVSEEVSMEETVEFNKNIIVETEEFAFLVDNAEVNKIDNTWSVKVYMQNKTDSILNFSWKDMSVNNSKVDTSWNYGVMAGEKDRSVVVFDIAEFETKGIKNVETLKFTLSVEDEEGKVVENTEYIFSLTVLENTTI